MNTCVRGTRGALFGGALLCAGISTGSASAQLQFDGFAQVTIDAYRCVTPAGDPCNAVDDCNCYAYSISLIAADPDGNISTDSVVIGDSVFTGESTPTRLAVTRTDRPSGVDAEFEFPGRVYAYAYFSLTEDATIDFDFNLGFPGQGQATLTLGASTFGLGASGQVDLGSGAPVQVSGRGDQDALTFRIDVVGDGPCSVADVGVPLGVLDLADVDAFIGAFLAGDALADIAFPFGFIDLSDVDAFIGAYLAGCP